jgi:thiamine biosynthesis lipoprotein
MEIQAMDVTCARFSSTSELTKVNRSGGKWVPISSLLGSVIDVAIGAAEYTGGAVDPTTPRMFEVLGTHPEHERWSRSDRQVPLGAPAAPAGRWRTVDRHPSGRAVRLGPGVHMDLDVIASALCVDRAAARVVEELGGGAMVRVGRNVVAAGAAPDGSWRVGVVDGAQVGSRIDECVVVLRTGGLAQAGPLAAAPRRPSSGLGGTNGARVPSPPTRTWRAVTAVAPSCLDARVAADASVVWGDRAVSRLAQMGVAARLVGHHDEVVELGAWPGTTKLGDGGTRAITRATA